MEIVIYDYIKEFPNYEISNQGQVFDMIKKMFINSRIDKTGYMYVYLNKKKRYIHNLVAQTFFNNIENKKVTHIDGNILNNFSENLTLHNKHNYGETARKNGDKFEKDIVFILNDNSSEIRKNFLEFIINKNIINNTDNIFFEKVPGSKVKSIFGKKTTSKADIWMNIENKKYPISLKMTNEGTQLHISPINNFLKYMEKNDCIITDNLKKGLEKFCGLIQPDKELLSLLNNNRSFKTKNRKRFWMNELDSEERYEIISFLKTYKEQTLKYIFSEGMCLEDDYKPNLFIFNKVSYTNTQTLDPVFYTLKDITNIYGKGDVKITKDNSLEISKYIGLQMKGSGKEKASYHSLQFKDRGLKF